CIILIEFAITSKIPEGSRLVPQQARRDQGCLLAQTMRQLVQHPANNSAGTNGCTVGPGGAASLWKRRPSRSLFRLTAIMTLAPIAGHSETGTGFEIPP